MVIVNLNKYQILLKTVELGSITRAAEALGYTQSAVSRVIADLEREWDMELLTRSRTGVQRPDGQGAVKEGFLWTQSKRTCWSRWRSSTA